MRIASYNVENLFARAKALNQESWAAGRPILAAHAELNTILQNETYDDTAKKRILELLDTLGLTRSDESEFVRLRRVRGRLLKRPKTGPVQVVATGRPSWIGWIELKTEQVDDLAMQHTAMVIRDVNADVLGVVEADSRPVLKLFSGTLLQELGATPYEQVMLVDGNDDRGIDVGILARGTYPLQEIRTHVFDVDSEGVVFSRDCCEYHLRTPGGAQLVVLVNHLKSKGYSEKGDPQGKKKRARQAKRIAEIYQGLRDSGVELIAIVGDLNDDPNSVSLQPLLGETDLTDISTHPNFDYGTRKGTFGSGNEPAKIDYVLLSPDLYARATGGAIFRMGVWHGPQTKNPWPIYDTLTGEVHAASDHAAIYADIDL